jgi:riboflavin biosynthesis pyrimidine reductase
MSEKAQIDRREEGSAPLRLRRLLPPGEPAEVAEIVRELGLWERPAGGPRDRPRVLLNMISTADGRATLDGRSGPLSGAADRELFHALRLPADAVLVGAGTVRAERYRRLVRDQAGRALRVQRGLSEEPLACIVSRSLTLGPGIPLLEDPDARVLVLTASEGQLPDVGARVDYVRAAREGELDLREALARLHRDFSVGVLLCEGGPHLGAQLLAEGLLDELYLSVSPKLAGGDPRSGSALRILAGAELRTPAELQLLGAFESDSHLFLRYGVATPERVSRETTPSSSLAS